MPKKKIPDEPVEEPVEEPFDVYDVPWIRKMVEDTYRESLRNHVHRPQPSDQQETPTTEEKSRFMMPSFPPGTRFWGGDSGDIPIAVIPVEGGGVRRMRFDSKPPQYGGSLLDGVEITFEEFKALVEKFQDPEYKEPERPQKCKWFPVTDESKKK